MSQRTTVHRAVWRSADGRLRTVWSIIVGIALLLVAYIIPTVALQPTGLSQDDPFFLIASSVLSLAVLGVLFVTFARRVDRRRLTEYGFDISQTWWADFVVGFVAATSIVLVWMGGSLAIGWASIDGTTSLGLPSLIYWAALLGIALFGQAIVQSVVFCGIVLRNAIDGLHMWGLDPTRAVAVGWLVSLAIFSLLHLVIGNPEAFEGVTLFGMMIIWTSTGVLMLLGYVLTGELAWPIAANTAINFIPGYFLVATDSLGFPAVVRIEHTPASILEPFGGLLVPSYVVGVGILLVWTGLRSGSGIGVAERFPRPHSSN